MTRLAALACTLAALAAAGCGGDEGDATADGTTGAPSNGTLSGSVGPGFDISLSGTDGIAPGTYTLTVADMASSHNFHLTGPGVDVSTSVGEQGEESFEVTLEPGEYTFLCDPHAARMRGTFTVG